MVNCSGNGSPIGGKEIGCARGKANVLPALKPVSAGVLPLHP